MKNKLINFKESGIFLMVFMLLCSFLGVADGSAMTADAVFPDGGGAIRNDMVTITNTRVDSPHLILDTIDTKVTKIRPHDVVLDTIARNIKDVKKSDNQVIRHYAIDVIDLTTTLAANVTTGNQVVLTTPNSEIFASEQTILVKGVPGYMPDGTTVDPKRDLMLYVVSKDTANNPIVTAVNGQGATRDIVPALTAGTTLIRMGRAGAETQISTDPYSGVPTDFQQYLQKFMAQVEMSYLFERADKEVDWEFTDAEEEAIFDMKRTQNATFWRGVKSLIKKKNAHIQKPEDIYFTEGIWTQAGKEFSFEGAEVNEGGIVRLMKEAFTGNASGKRKILIAGSDVIEKFEAAELATRVIKEGSRNTAYGLEFSSLISKFGTLMVVHDQSLDDLDMSDKFFILDPDFLRKWTMGWRVTNFELRKSGQADADGRGLMEICGLVLKNPMAHVRGSLSAF